MINDLYHVYATQKIPAAKQLILDFLRTDDYHCYTYNELSRMLNIPVGVARSACQVLTGRKEANQPQSKENQKEAK